MQREVDSVHALGLNAVQNHRHFPKAAVLDGFDRAGLLRYCEPGGGSAIWDETEKPIQPPGVIDPSGKDGEPVTFANRYEFAKLLAMIKAYRSHPSVIMWSLNNETGSGSHNSKMFYAMQKAQEIDPSRIVVLKSGFGPEGEIMARPYTKELAYGESVTGHDSGWHDIHNEEDAGVYQDSLYLSPENYKTYSVDTKGIAMWGELGTANSPDNDAAVVRWYEAHHASGYTLAAAQARVAAYKSFLVHYQFNKAFPTAEDLFRAIGVRHYFAASHIVENARMSDANDYIALTGWESTTIDNNSGLVDSLRNLKGDPSSMPIATAPEALIIRPRHYVVAKNESAAADAYIVNERGWQGSYTLRVTAAMDGNKNSNFFDTTVAVTLTGGDVFAQLLKADIRFVAPQAGQATLTLSLTASDSSKPVLQRTEPMLFVDPSPAPIARKVALVDGDGSLGPALKQRFGLQAEPLLSSTDKVDDILVSSSGSPRYTWTERKPETLSRVENTQNQSLYSQQYIGSRGRVIRLAGFAPGELHVELFFAEPRFDDAGERAFDVELNHEIILHNFDIAQEAGGKGKAVVRTFSVKSPDGVLELSVPVAERGNPLFAAIRITDKRGQIVRRVFRKDNLHDAAGEEWRTVVDDLAGFDWDSVIREALPRVRAGSRLILMGMDAEDMGHAAEVLAKDGVLSYAGRAGYDDTPWLGHWYFARKHWLLDGLPVDCVLDWQYQTAAPGDGLVLDAQKLEAVIGYGKNPSPGLGLGAAVVPVDHGEIILLAMGGLANAFLHDDPKGFQPLAATRIIYNALQHTEAAGR